MSVEAPTRETRRSFDALVGTIFVAGLAMSLVMVARSQVTEDQMNLLARGWRFAAEGSWLWYGVPASAGGHHPGGLMSLLTGLPLLVWADHRAATLLLLASHVVAFFALDRTLGRALSAEERVLFAALFWLNPWRLFFSGFLWNPSFLFACGALHLATAYHLRRRTSFLGSFAHVLVIGLALQLHMSALLLVAATVALWWRRYLRLDLAGAAAAATLVGLSLAPWMMAAVGDPAIRPVSDGTVGYGLTSPVPIARGVLQWIRFPALSLNRSMACLDFTALGAGTWTSLGAGLRAGLAVPTVVVSLWANWRLWRIDPVRWASFGPELSDREWVVGVVRWSFLAALGVFALSPIGLSSHNVFSIFHLAVVPMVLWLGSWRGRRIRLPRAVAAYAALTLAISLALALASPPYRCGGPRCESDHFRLRPLRADHPMFDALAIRDTCPIASGDPNGFWPDGLSDPGELAERGVAAPAGAGR